MVLNLKHVAIAALGATALVPAAASAQSYGYGYPVRPYASVQSYGYDAYRSDRSERLMDRTERLSDWIRRGSEEGWLRGWKARRAWRELRDIRQLADSGYDRNEAWQRLQRLTDFVRDARQGAY